VRQSGEIRWAGGLIYVSTALVGETVAIEESEEGELRMRFYDKPLGVIEPEKKRLRRVGVPARGHAHPSNLSPM